MDWYSAEIQVFQSRLPSFKLRVVTETRGVNTLCLRLIDNCYKIIASFKTKPMIEWSIESWSSDIICQYLDAKLRYWTEKIS